MTIELAAGSYGVAMALAPLLQLRRMRVIRSSRDVSLAYLAVLLTGFALYLWYGISIGNRVLIVTNAVSILATATTLSVGLALRRHDQPTVEPRRWERQQAPDHGGGQQSG